MISRYNKRHLLVSTHHWFWRRWLDISIIRGAFILHLGLLSHTDVGLRHSCCGFLGFGHDIELLLLLSNLICIVFKHDAFDRWLHWGPGIAAVGGWSDAAWKEDRALLHITQLINFVIYDLGVPIANWWQPLFIFEKCLNSLVWRSHWTLIQSLAWLHVIIIFII